MRNLVVCLGVYLMLSLSYYMVKASEVNANNEAARVERYIGALYTQLDFSNMDRLSPDVFSKAMHGYLNLKNSGKLGTSSNILSVCDFNQPSVLNRLWVIDLSVPRILYNTYVAHGQGTGDDCAVKFSNRANSHQSSLGFYITDEVYEGGHGTSLRLKGLDKGFNDAAFRRDIVVHGADYVSDKFIADNNRLGRSWGCPAVPLAMAEPIINSIKGGSCLFIYYPDSKYLKTSYWLNKRVSTMPDADMMAVALTPAETRHPATRTIHYHANGVIDTVDRS